MDIHDAPLQALINKFNAMYKMPGATYPSLHGVGNPVERLLQFGSIMRKELDEATDILQALNGVMTPEMVKLKALLPDSTPEELVLTALADWFADIAVYAFSEAARFGLPAEGAFRIVMASNFSKMGDDGLPIYDSEMKLQKGPNYKRPEPQLLEVIRALLTHEQLELQSLKAGANHQLTDTAVAEQGMGTTADTGEVHQGVQNVSPPPFGGAVGGPPA